MPVKDASLMDTESDLQLSHISDMPSNCSPNTDQYKVHTNRARLQGWSWEEEKGY